MKQFKSLSLVTVFVALLFLQSQVAKALQDFDPTLAKKLVSDGALLLDVRTPGEFNGGHIKGAELIPISQLEGKIDRVLKLQKGDKTKPIVVYCAAGVRAGRAKKILTKAGFTQVTNLGGIKDWPKK